MIKKTNSKLRILMQVIERNLVNIKIVHYVKSVRTLSFCGSYFPAFELNTEGYGVSLRIQSECEKIRTKKTPNTVTFHAVVVLI